MIIINNQEKYLTLFDNLIEEMLLFLKKKYHNGRLCQSIPSLSSTVGGHFFIRPYGFEPSGHFIIQY